MTKTLCFSWNTDHTALCENGSGTNKDAYLNAGSKDLIEKSFFTLTKRQPCYNPLFFESIKAAIIEYTPDIVAISNEGDIESGTYFHSDFLPYNMENNLGFNKYRLLVRDKYQADDDNSLRMSIYVKSTGTSIQSIEINKSTLFNNYQCTSNLGSALVLQIKMSNDTIAFIDLQLAYQNQNSSSCIKEIETGATLLNVRPLLAKALAERSGERPPRRRDMPECELGEGPLRPPTRYASADRRHG